jgi:two-component system, NarL family, nitrate/nitrite response regulator NarL
VEQCWPLELGRVNNFGTSGNAKPGLAIKASAEGPNAKSDSGIALSPPKGAGPIRLVVVDDHPVVRKGLCSCLGQHAHLAVVGEAADGQDALRQAAALQPDIVLMDIDMPHMNGLTATELLRKQLPHIKVLILSMHNNQDYVLRIVRSGASGYVLKGAAPEELVKAIEVVQAGQTFFSEEVARVALNQFVHSNGSTSQITNREREVLILIAEGLSNKEIAHKLRLGVRTVETHRERIMRKLNVHSIAGLTKYAIAKGWVILPPEPVSPSSNPP